ncbi:endo-1,4-beta-xylanase [Streptomyces europaeiscabiei]|uniref:endo-1,4-beta-xylanase n=1 Tax=Streptomyces europaeiscabiei TaxID=146819 RepID=UPI0038D4596D
MKWDVTERSRGSFTFGPADQIVNRATARGRRVRGQTRCGTPNCSCRHQYRRGRPTTATHINCAVATGG